MKRVVVAILALSFIATAGYTKSIAPVEVDWAALNVKTWDEAFFKLVPEPTEAGNAFACFTHASGGDLFAQTSPFPTKPGYEWWNKLYTGMDQEPTEEQKGYIAQGIKIEELDHLVDGSLKRSYSWVGTFAGPSTDPKVPLMEIPIPRVVDIMKLQFLLIQRAMDKQAKGDVAGGEADMFAALRVGHIMQKDVLLIGFMVGTAMEFKAAKAMVEFQRKAGKEDKAKEWEAFAAAAEARREKAKSALKALNYLSMKQLAAVADDATIPRAYRIEALSFAISADVLNRKSSVVFGLSDDLKKLVTAHHFDDPELLILQFKLIEDVYAGMLTKASTRLILRQISKPE